MAREWRGKGTSCKQETDWFKAYQQCYTRALHHCTAGADSDGNFEILLKRSTWTERTLTLSSPIPIQPEKTRWHRSVTSQTPKSQREDNSKRCFRAGFAESPHTILETSRKLSEQADSRLRNVRQRLREQKTGTYDLKRTRSFAVHDPDARRRR